jgi:hypothetical protein
LVVNQTEEKTAVTDTFRRVPCAPDPRALYYWEADAYASTKTSDEAIRIHFAWYAVDHGAEFMSVGDAWNSTEWRRFLNTKMTPPSSTN